MSAQVFRLPLGPLQTNCYVLACSTTRMAAVIDPSWAGESIIAFLEEQGLQLERILLTHAHFDHVGGLAALKETSQAPIAIHPDAVHMLAQAHTAAAVWGIPMDIVPDPDEFLTDGQTLAVGTIELAVLYTPGHAPGHVSFYAAADRLIFDGDVLFQGSIGRTDLPGGDLQLLMKSIRERLLVLPRDTVVLSGHGPETTIGREIDHNPFLIDSGY